MDRRNFLRMMVGGVAASAAVRTFPFRVYSFPKEIKLEPLPLPDFVTLNRYYIHLTKEGVYRIDSVGNHILSVRPSESWVFDEWMKSKQQREMELAEAKRIFPGPFHWQDHDRVRYSVLQPDGSVVDV